MHVSEAVCVGSRAGRSNRLLVDANDVMETWAKPTTATSPVSMLLAAR